MTQIKGLLGPIRLPFLILTPACIFLAMACSIYINGVEHLHVLHSLLLLVGALSAHMSVNALNEYFDFKSGLDFTTQPTAFSGGSGTLPKEPALAKYTLFAGGLCAVMCGVIGVYFLGVVGMGLLPIGLMGMALVLLYTPFITRNATLSLLSAGLGFGPLMIMGSYYILNGEYAGWVFLISLMPFFLVNNLLLLNQFPDVNADKAVGRKNLVILLGTKKSAKVYALFLSLAFLVLIISVAFRLVPVAALAGLILLPVAIWTGIGVIKHHGDVKALLPFMALNVAMNILMPVVVGIGLVAAS